MSGKHIGLFRLIYDRHQRGLPSIMCKFFDKKQDPVWM